MFYNAFGTFSDHARRRNIVLYYQSDHLHLKTVTYAGGGGSDLVRGAKRVLSLEILFKNRDNFCDQDWTEEVIAKTIARDMLALNHLYSTTALLVSSVLQNGTRHHMLQCRMVSA